MSRIVDDDPPIKTGVTSQAYRDNWDRIFGDDVIEKALRPNESPIIETVTVRDADTGSELDVTRHEDGSVTVVAERIVTAK